jgi:hypothetical protein
MSSFLMSDPFGFLITNVIFNNEKKIMNFFLLQQHDDVH